MGETSISRCSRTHIVVRARRGCERRSGRQLAKPPFAVAMQQAAWVLNGLVSLNALSSPRAFGSAVTRGALVCVVSAMHCRRASVRRSKIHVTVTVGSAIHGFARVSRLSNRTWPSGYVRFRSLGVRSCTWSFVWEPVRSRYRSSHTEVVVSAMAPSVSTFKANRVGFGRRGEQRTRCDVPVQAAHGGSFEPVSGFSRRAQVRIEGRSVETCVARPTLRRRSTRRETGACGVCRIVVFRSHVARKGPTGRCDAG